MTNPPRACAYVGNFEPTYSTENEYLHALRVAGHTVHPVQEGDPRALVNLLEDIRRGHDFDFVLWTRTRSLADQVGDAGQWELAHACHRAGIPLVGVHLDIWIGLEREQQIATDPYFKALDLFCTADGGHQDEWKLHGVNHRWLLPAISERWIGVGEPQQRFRAKIGFVGSWQGGYHKEAKHRHELVRWLQRTYGKHVRFWPEHGHPAIRGRELNDLYASVDVVVGDSCIVGGNTHYCSDRVPETLGRGGLLLHPWVEGINMAQGDPFYVGELGWLAGDWTELKNKIDAVLDQDETMRDMERIVVAGLIEHEHTYTHRVHELLTIMAEERLL